MRSLSFLLLASLALTLPSFSPSPCSALQVSDSSSTGLETSSSGAGLSLNETLASSSSGVEGSSGAGGPNGGITSNGTESSTGLNSFSSSSTGLFNNGTGSGGNGGTPNGAAKFGLSWRVGAAAVVLGLSAVVGAVGVL